MSENKWMIGRQLISPRLFSWFIVLSLGVSGLILLIQHFLLPFFAGYFATLFFLVSGCFLVFQGFQGVAKIREEKKYHKIVSALKNKDIWGDILGGIVMLLMAILFIWSSGNAAGDLVLPILTIFSPLEVFVVVWVVWLALRHFRAQKTPAE